MEQRGATLNLFITQTVKLNIAFSHTDAKNGGYGVLANGIAKAIEAHPGMSLVKRHYVGKEHKDETYSKESPDVVLTYGTPEAYKYARKKYRNKPFIHYSVWESSIYPEAWAELFADVDLLLTATKYTQKTIRKAGLNSSVWHHAIDDRFQYREAVDDKVFTFYHYNGYEYRKGTEILLQAFTKEFGVNEPVKLVIKSREIGYASVYRPENKYRILGSEPKLQDIGHPLVEEVIGHVSDEKMVELGETADCFVFPAKGEGWGLPPFEAMAMGIVPILPNKGAFTEWFDDENMIDVEIDGYYNGGLRYPGALFLVSEEDLMKKMRWAYDNQDELKEMGIRGSAGIREKYDWDKIIKDFYQYAKSTMDTK